MKITDTSASLLSSKLISLALPKQPHQVSNHEKHPDVHISLVTHDYSLTVYWSFVEESHVAMHKQVKKDVYHGLPTIEFHLVHRL